MAALKLDFYEYRPDLNGVVDRVWWSCALDPSDARLRKDTRRPYVSLAIGTPPFLSRIPCDGYLTVDIVEPGREKDRVFTAVYDGVPTVKSSVIEANVPPPNLLAHVARRGAHAFGLIRPGPAGYRYGWTSEQLESEYAGYTACPDTPWIQIGKTSDSVTVQVRLEKVAPIDTERSFALGSFYIYHPTRVVVNFPGLDDMFDPPAARA